MPTTCALCRQIIPDEKIRDPQVVQEHHLRPEDRAESPTVMLCRPCHKQIHAVFTNEELWADYDTITALLMNRRKASSFTAGIRAVTE